MNMRKIFFSVLFVAAVSVADAQVIDLDKLNFKDLNLKGLSIDELLGRTLNVKKGFAPKFSIGDISLKKIPDVAKLLNIKGSDQINRLFRTFRTGRTVFHIAGYTGSAVALYGTVQTIANNAKSQVSDALKKDAKTILITGLSAAATGLIVKMLTKAASYKAVDMFNGVVRDKVNDIFGIEFKHYQPSPYSVAQVNGVALVIHL